MNILIFIIFLLDFFMCIFEERKQYLTFLFGYAYCLFVCVTNRTSCVIYITHTFQSYYYQTSST